MRGVSLFLVDWSFKDHPHGVYMAFFELHTGRNPTDLNNRGGLKHHG